MVEQFEIDEVRIEHTFVLESVFFLGDPVADVPCETTITVLCSRLGVGVRVTGKAEFIEGASPAPGEPYAMEYYGE